MTLGQTQNDEISQKLAEIRNTNPWAANFDDETLLRMVKKHGWEWFNVEPVPWFVWGEDPITGKVIPAVSKLAFPAVGIFAAVLALFFVMRMK